MSIVAVPSPNLRRIPIFRIGNRRRQFPKKFVSPVMKEESAETKAATCWKKEGSSDEGQKILKGLPLFDISSGSSDLRFDRLQPSIEECDCKHKRDFGRFLAREAILGEEFWTAAWLRAESHWEEQPDVRHVESYKRKFAEQEFHALKRRCSSQLFTAKSTCIITVKKEERNVKRTILSSIVGTLDITIRHLFCGETFPGERVKAPVFCSIYRTDRPIYGYVSNLTVAKYARRQGIASNMLLLAVEAAKSYGANQVFVHVHKDNTAAQKLYEKLGFQIVEKALSRSLEEQNYLLCFDSSHVLCVYKGVLCCDPSPTYGQRKN